MLAYVSIILLRCPPPRYAFKDTFKTNGQVFTIGHMNICHYICLVSANASKGLSKWQKWDFIKGDKCSSLATECQSPLVHLLPISSFHISTSYPKSMKKLMYQSSIVCMRLFKKKNHFTPFFFYVFLHPLLFFTILQYFWKRKNKKRKTSCVLITFSLHSFIYMHWKNSLEKEEKLGQTKQT